MKAKRIVVAGIASIILIGAIGVTRAYAADNDGAFWRTRWTSEQRSETQSIRNDFREENRETRDAFRNERQTVNFNRSWRGF